MGSRRRVLREPNTKQGILTQSKTSEAAMPTHRAQTTCGWCARVWTLEGEPAPPEIGDFGNLDKFRFFSIIQVRALKLDEIRPYIGKKRRKTTFLQQNERFFVNRHYLGLASLVPSPS